MLTEITLKQCVTRENFTAKELALHIGLSPSAVTQMLSSSRDVRVILDDKEKIIGAYEVKRIGNFKVSRKFKVGVCSEDFKRSK